MNIIPYFRQNLKNVLSDQEIVNCAYISMSHLLGYSRSDCIINSNQQLSIGVSHSIKGIVSELKTCKPIQYILGSVIFYDLELKVTSNTLIPRPETEELVKWILKYDFNRVLDIGTGSGCIAIALAVNSNAKVLACDISQEAIKVARNNSKKNNVDIDFFQQDIFQTDFLPEVDLIVSNPPYILESEKPFMNRNVIDFEPSKSLFVESDNPIIFYDKISDLALRSLSPYGALYFEINERFGFAICEMLEKKGFVDIELKKDINDKQRMIKSRKK